MKHTKANSSQIHTYGYDPVEQQLEVTFHCNGKDGCAGSGKHASGMECAKCGGRGHKGIYSYPGVPADVYGKFRDAESKGSAFGSLIRGKYKHVFTPGR